MSRKPELHIHVNQDKEVLALLHKILEIIMAESAEMTAFRARVEAALANIVADINKLLQVSTGLSAEDKAALEKIATDLEAAAGIVPD